MIDSRTISSDEDKENNLKNKADLAAVFPKKNLLNKRFIRNGVLITTTILWAVILLSIIYTFDNDKRQITTIYYNNQYTVFQTDIVSVIIILIILLCNEFDLIFEF